MTLEEAKATRLMGNPESWNNNGRKPLVKVPDAVLRQARRFFREKRDEAHEGARRPLREMLQAIDLVLADRETNSPQERLAL